MAERKMEGNNEQRRKSAREARERGNLPSEEGVTLGASKQAKKAKKDDSHQERLEQRSHGKQQLRPSDDPRPGNRDEDPKRTNRWG